MIKVTHTLADLIMDPNQEKRFLRRQQLRKDGVILDRENPRKNRWSEESLRQDYNPSVESLYLLQSKVWV